MDDDGLNMRNWGYYEPSFKEHLGLQLMSPMGDQRDTKPFLSSRDPITVNANGAYHPRNCVEAPVPLNYMRDSWIQRERLLHMLPGNTNYGGYPESSTTHHHMQIMQPMDSSSKDQGMSEEDIKPDIKKGGSSGTTKKQQALGVPKAPKSKKPKKCISLPAENENSSAKRSKIVKKSMEVVLNGIDMDISGIPTPVCSCTGTPQQCYRWGCGGWQSACCTTTISTYPLPMSTKRRGSRIAGRKMSQGAFKKVLEKLASEGYDFSKAIDLKSHWAKHGTNKFVTIR